MYYQAIKAGLTPGSDAALIYMLDRMKSDFHQGVDPELIQVYGIITKMMTRYIKEHSMLIDGGMQVLNVEQQVIYPMENYAMFGYCDLVYRDRSGVLHIRDHKTGDRAQTKLDAQFSNQLLFYAAVIYKSTGELPVAEINYINTKEYQKKIVPYEDAFVLSKVTYTKKELDIYFSQICMVIESMLQSEPLPFYGTHCRWCPFQTPCFLSRKGIDPSPVLAQNFVRVPRDSQGRHASFTQDNSNGDGTD